MCENDYPSVSIVILNYNGFKLGHLRTALSSVLKTNYPNFEVIVVDNGSTDNSVNFIKTNYPNIRIIKLKKNYGTSIGYMMGALHAKGKYVAILNNDIEVDVDWLRPLVNYLEKNSIIVAADPKFRNFFERKRFEDVAAAGRWIDYFGNNYTRGVNEFDHGQYDKPVYIIGVQSLYKRDILIKCGGFDPYYIYGYEDIDLGWRLYLMGYKVLYVPQSVIYHKGGGTTRSVKYPKPGFYYLNKRNRLITIFKNYSVENMIIALSITLMEYLFIMLYFILTGKKAYLRSIFLSIYKFFINLKYIAKKRIKVQSMRKVSDKYIKRYMVPYSGIIWNIVNELW